MGEAVIDLAYKTRPWLTPSPEHAADFRAEWKKSWLWRRSPSGSAWLGGNADYQANHRRRMRDVAHDVLVSKVAGRRLIFGQVRLLPEWKLDDALVAKYGIDDNAFDVVAHDVSIVFPARDEKHAFEIAEKYRVWRTDTDLPGNAHWREYEPCLQPVAELEEVAA